jgi:SRSO17 transposase
MMAAVAEMDVDAPGAVKERLEGFAAEVLAEAMNRPVQVANGGLYLRGLIEQGPRKSLEPLVARLGGEADYQSMQQFLADSPWDPAAVVRAVAERVAPELGVEAWVLDDTGFPKDGKDSPGVKRQYSGTLGKIGNCQIGVSVHAVGERGTVPLGWALYLPEDWCEDAVRRRKAKIPDEIEFETKPELGAELIERTAGWQVPRASMTPLSSTCSRLPPRRASSRPARASRSPSEAARQAHRRAGCERIESRSRSRGSSPASRPTPSRR